MEPLQAVMFVLVKQFAQEFVPSPLQAQFAAALVEAQQVLAGDPRLAEWVESKVARIDTWQGVLQPPRLPDDVLSVISAAIFNNQYLEILYHSEKGERRKEVRPLALIERDEVFYAALQFSGYQDVRLLAIHRIQEATVMPTSCAAKKQPFSLDSFLQHGLPFASPGGERLDIQLRLEASTYRTYLGRQLRGTSSVSEPVDGWFEVKAEGVPNTMELRWWLLGLGEKVFILAPESLAVELQYLLYDSLTGLLSRRACQEHLERMSATVLRSGRTSAVALIDIDHFKSINDNFGHGAGDMALGEIARRIKSACRSMDIVSRWGGEEFLVLLPDTSLQEAVSLAERIRLAIASTACLLDAFGTAREITVSIGVATIRKSAEMHGIGISEKIDAVLKEADSALYAAKVSRNCVKCSDRLPV